MFISWYGFCGQAIHKAWVTVDIMIKTALYFSLRMQLAVIPTYSYKAKIQKLTPYSRV